MKPASLVALSALILLSACSGAGSHPNRIASITISPATATIAKGQTQQFTGTGTTNDGSTVSGSGTWSSSNPQVASVDQNGLALGIAPGTTTISGTVQTGSGPVTGTATLTVTAPPTPTVTSLSVTPATVTLNAGQTQQLTATETLSDGSTKDVTSSAAWSSSNTAVASVSASGLLTGVAAGQAKISAAVQGISGSDAVTVNAKALTSIAVAPATANLGVGISQRYVAIGTYSDGTTADVTQLVSWSSTSPSATVTSQGVVSTVSQGDTDITATAGSVKGTAPLTVNASTDGLTLINDLTDPRLITYTGTDGSSGMLLGTRDSNGDPATLTGITATTPDGTQAQYLLDSQGRPQSIKLSDNSKFLYSWSSATSGVVTVIGSDGSSTISTPIDLTQATGANAVAKAKSLRAQSLAAPLATSTPTGPSLTVHVTSCAGRVNEDWADVVLNLPGGTIGIGPVGSGAGYYTAQLPSGPSPNATLQAASQVTNGACNVSQIVTASCAVITAAVVVAGDGVPAAVATSVDAACTTIGVSDTVLSQICNAAAKLTKLNSVVTWFRNQLAVPIPITVSLASLVPMPALAQPNLGGTYPEVDVDFPCPIVDHVDVVPANATIAEQQKISLNATARDSNDKVLFSSAFNFSWTPDGTGDVIDSFPDFQGDNPFGTDSITGISSGGPVTVTATEATSGKEGTSAITVTAPQPTVSLTVTWTVSNSADGWNGTDTLTINRDGTWNYTGHLTDGGGGTGCTSTRTESGSGSGWTPPPLPDPPEFFLSFPVTFSTTNRNESACGSLAGHTFTGTSQTFGVNIVATPAAGGYTLSTDTLPDYNLLFGNVSVTANGFLYTK